jgi:hypothetical protein
MNRFRQFEGGKKSGKRGHLPRMQKIQDQTLDNVKKIQAVQIATLNTVCELITELPTTEGAATFARITELGNSFATQLLDAGSRRGFRRPACRCGKAGGRVQIVGQIKN